MFSKKVSVIVVMSFSEPTYIVKLYEWLRRTTSIMYGIYSDPRRAPIIINWPFIPNQAHHPIDETGANSVHMH